MKKADSWSLGMAILNFSDIFCFMHLWTLRAQFIKLWQPLCGTQELAWFLGSYLKFALVFI